MLFVRIAHAAVVITLIALIATALLWPQLRGTARADNTGFQSPSDTHAPENQWVTPRLAFELGVATASAIGNKQGYSAFGFSVAGGAFILGIAVQVNAKALDASGCDLQVTLSGEGGSNPSTPQIADLTDSFTDHTLGGSNDTWDRDWTSGEFTDTNFVVTVEYINTGGCNDTDISLDTLRVNVYFKSVTPGDLHPPTLSQPPNGWSDPNNAFASDTDYATASGNADQGYANFNLSVPSPSIITGIEVVIEAFSSDPSGCQIQARVSGNGGDTIPNFSSFPKETAELTDTETLHILGGPEELWNSTWLAASFSNINFALELHNNDPDPGNNVTCTDAATTSLNQVQVRVYFKPLQQTGKSSPSATPAPSEWTNPGNAFASDNADATGRADSTATDEQAYGNFGLSTIPTSSLIVGIEVQVEAHSDDLGNDCALNVQIFGRSGFTAAETANLTVADDDYVLGGQEDLWGATWTPNDFSDANFVVKVTAIDPGTDCANTAVTSLDHIQVNVFYKQIADSGFRSPLATATPSEWTDPQNAFSGTDGNLDATGRADSTATDEQAYGNFGLSVPADSIITGIEVRAEAHSSDAGGACELDVELSPDGGAGFILEEKTAVLTGSDVVYSLGGSSDTWGETWSAGDFSNTNFVVKVTAVDPGGCLDAAVTSLDHIEVNVYFKSSTPPVTNTATSTNTPTITSTPTITPTATITPTPTTTDTPTATITPTATDTPTATATPPSTNTPTQTATPPRTATPVKLLGDVNLDTFVNSIDALFILQFNARLLGTLPNAANAEVNCDDVINALDAALILQFGANFLTALPGCP